MERGPWTRGLMLLLIQIFLGVGRVAAATCNPRDQAALIEFRNQLSDSQNVLASWKDGGNCCEFEYVTCNQQGQVINVTLVSPLSALQRKSSGKGNLVGRTFSQLPALLSFSGVDFNLDVVPTGLSVLPNLQVFFFEYSNFQGLIPADIGGIRNLQTLVLRFANRKVTGPIPTTVCNLRELQTLDLSESGYAPVALGSKTGPIPACIGSLLQLQNLVLEYNQFSGPVPRSLSTLPDLQVLKLSGNKFSGPLPALGQPGLQLLYLQGNDFSGPVPRSYARLASLQELRLGGFEDLNNPPNAFSLGRIIPSPLSGPFPSFLQTLSNLKVLIIRGTSIFGALPNAFGSQLVNLEILALNQNKLTGRIPQGLGSTSLNSLFLNDNHLAGFIPTSLGNLANLTEVDASTNLLSGPIPPQLSQLKQLLLLNFSSNRLTGSIPENLVLQPQGTLDLSYNQLTGSLNPPSLYTLYQLFLQHNQLTSLGSGSVDAITANYFRVFDAHSNQLSGPVPLWVFQLPLTALIDLSDNHFTALPPSLPFSANILNLSSNAITGPIPTALLDNFPTLTILDLSSNLFTGPLDSSLPPSSFSILNLSHNHLSGPIPAGLLSTPTLDLSHNLFSGPIPPLSAPILLLNIAHNALSGPIPDLTPACSTKLLDAIILSNNRLAGPLRFPASCPSLVLFSASSNLLSGPIPDSAAAFPSLRVLDLANNSLTGSVGTFLASLHSLQVLDLSRNALSGPVPFQQLAAGSLTIRTQGTGAPYKETFPAYFRARLILDLGYLGSVTLQQDSVLATNAIDLSYNKLSGPLDPAIAQLKGLHVLRLAHNRFSGQVPDAIRHIPDLEVLDLSYNQFTTPGS